MTRNGIPAESTAGEDILGRSALAAKVADDDQQPGFNAVRASERPRGEQSATCWPTEDRADPRCNPFARQASA